MLHLKDSQLKRPIHGPLTIAMKSFLFALKVRFTYNMLRYKSPSLKEDQRLTTPEEVTGGILFFMIQIARVMKHRSSRTFICLFIYFCSYFFLFSDLRFWDTGQETVAY